MQSVTNTKKKECCARERIAINKIYISAIDSW